ncbi:hypothetical protein LJC27_01935 [Christensenellaceae bacterium OttesenSCG-928-M15]|nr:hypothetical protein [Christensenellaceae bacterium OttesenSCG-928-M15]
MTVAEWYESKMDCMSDAEIRRRLNRIGEAYAYMLMAAGIKSVENIPSGELVDACELATIRERNNNEFELKIDTATDPIILKYGTIAEESII